MAKIVMRHSDLNQTITRLFLCLAFALVAACEPSFEYSANEAKRRLVSNGWPEYGGGQGQRYFRDSIVNKDNAHRLELAWVY